MPASCPQHPQVEKAIETIHERLQEKRDRILVLELEAKTMREKFDMIIISQNKILEKVDSFRTWQVWLMGAGAVVLFLYSLFSPTITAAIQRMAGL